MWRRNILHKKREDVKANLTDKLFLLDPVFRPVLLHHRHVCRDLEQFRLVSLYPGPVSSGNEALSLAEFAANQAKQRDFLGARIEEASASSRLKFRLGITQVLDELRKRINEFQ